jgi:rhamnosyltransferase subunit B
VRHERYLPLRHLLPRAAALVHHGGIGTSAEALRAGTPQLAVPLFFDQPDNALRLRTLGVGDVLEPDALTPDSLAENLQSLLASQSVKQKCGQIAASFDSDATERVCGWCEKLT